MDVARDKRQPEDTAESFIPYLSYKEALFLIVMFTVYVNLRDVIRHLSAEICICLINFYLMTLVHMLQSNFNP